MKHGFAPIAVAVVGLALVAGPVVTGCGDDDPASPQNRAPQITGLIADLSIVDPAGFTTVTCTSHDPDADDLTYAWGASHGELSGAGPVVTWVGPIEAGPCTLSVTVEDGQGGSDSDTTTVEVRGGTLLVQTDTEVRAVDMSGGHFSFYPSGRKIEVAGDRIFLDAAGISEISHSGALIDNVQRPAEAPLSYTSFAALPQGGFVFMENAGDTLTFVTDTGAFIENVVMPNASSVNQGMDGVVVGDRLVIAENGVQELVQVDLSSREVSVFKDLSHLGKWLDDIDHDHGFFYMINRDALYKFTETGVEEKIYDFPSDLVLRLAVVGKYAYCTDRRAGKIYRVNVLTGEGEPFLEGLDEPIDIEFLPVALQAP